MEPPLVELENVDKIYGGGEGQVQALKNVSLMLPEGEFVVMVGPSGSGKTTLLNIIGGLDRVTSGAIRVGGKELGRLTDSELTAYRRDSVGFVFQFYNLVPTLTARENVELVAELVPNPLDPLEVLAAVGLEDRARHFPSALSGGEQQRVAIARALVKRPALVLADEPTGNLDYETGVRVLDVMHRATHGWTGGVILVTHNHEITRMADRVVRMHSGEISEVEPNPSPAQATELEW